MLTFKDSGTLVCIAKTKPDEIQNKFPFFDPFLFAIL
jgi:hypothetical protein